MYQTYSRSKDMGNLGAISATTNTPTQTLFFWTVLKSNFFNKNI